MELPVLWEEGGCQQEEERKVCRPKGGLHRGRVENISLPSGMGVGVSEDKLQKTLKELA